MSCLLSTKVIDCHFLEPACSSWHSVSYRLKMSHFSLLQLHGDAKMWFSKLESIFISSDIQSVQSKLHIALSGVPIPLALIVRNMITRTSPDMTYESFKTEVLRHNSPSSESKFRTLLWDDHLGSRTLIEFSRWIREVSDSTYENQSFVKQLFFSRMPSNVQSILTPMIQHTAPLVMSRKNYPDFRLVGDYRCFNTFTIPDCYPLPNVQDFLSALHGCKTVFLKIDLVRAYHQIPVNFNDIPMTAVTTYFGAFEFLVCSSS